jgi:hypothetical protein
VLKRETSGNAFTPPKETKVDIASIAKGIAGVAGGALTNFVNKSNTSGLTGKALDILKQGTVWEDPSKSIYGQPILDKNGNQYIDSAGIGMVTTPGLTTSELFRPALTPYRQSIAPRISAAFLAASPTYRVANKDIVGDITTDLLTNSPIYRKAIEDSRKPVNANDDVNDIYARRIYSPGRSLNLLTANAVPGMQGAEKLNWEDGYAVNEFYDQGLPRFISGGSDAFFNLLDPINLVPVAGQAAKARYVTRTVNQRTLPVLLSEADAAKDPAVRNSFSPIFDAIEKAASSETFNPGGLDWHPMINQASVDVVPTLIRAQIIGGRELVSDAVQAGMDISRTKFDDFATKHAELAVEIQSLKNTERTVTSYIRDIMDPSRVTKPLDSADAFEQMIIPGTVNKLPPTIEETTFANFLIDDVVVKLREDIASKSREASLFMDIQGISTNMKYQTVPVTALRKLEERRIARGTKADDSYWGINDLPNGTRVAYWINPSTRIHETSRGIAEFSGPAGDRSHLEIAARLRDQAKITGKSGQWQRDEYNRYRMNQTKASRWRVADEQVANMQVDVATKHVPSVSSLDAEQQSIFRSIFETLNTKTQQKRSQIIRYAADHEYTVVVDNKDTLLPQMKSLIEDIALDLARTQGRYEATAADIRKVTDDLVRGTPTMESQIPGVHFAPSAKEVEYFVIDNKRALSQIVQFIKDGVYDSATIKEVVEAADNYVANVPSTISRTIPEGFVELKGILADTINAYQNHFWKPLTLLSFVYTSRNVGEGLGRVAVMAAEFHQDRGFKYTDMFHDFSNSGRIKRVGQNAKGRLEQKRASQEFAINFDKNTAGFSTEQIVAEDAFLNANDSVAMSMASLRDARNGIENYVAASPNQASGINGVRNAVNDLFTKDVPPEASQPFLDALIASDYRKAWELSTSMSMEQLTSSYAYIKSETNTAFSKLQDVASTGNATPGITKLLPNLYLHLNAISKSADVSMIALLNRAKNRGILEDYIANKKNFVKKISAGEGQFDPIPGSGYIFDDSFAGTIDGIMRGQVSSNASTTSTVLNVRNQIAEQAWNAQAKDDLIFPTVPVPGSKIGVINQNWAEAFSEHSNNIYHNDSVARLFLEGKDIEYVKTWVHSAEGAKWRETLRDEANRFPGSTGFDRIVELRSEDVNTRYPSIGANGEDLSALRQKVLDRTFTPEDSLKIPEMDRQPVRGTAITRHEDGKLSTVWRGYKSFVNGLFNAFGTIPEDSMVRFPFYRMMYRGEVRTATAALIAAGKNPMKYEQQILSGARAEAYKLVQERLYSIERKSDIGQLVQFMTPFYMSQQNSARFWIGSAARRPQLVGQALMLWNIPNKAGIVYDQNGEQAMFDTPWSVDNSQIIAGLPEPIAKRFGQPFIGFSKSSLDLAFQGQIPALPSLGGPVVDTLGSFIIRSMAGTTYDPDRFAMKIGLGPNFVGKQLIPFYKSIKDNPDAGVLSTFVRGATGYGSQYKALFNASSLANDNPTNAAMARVDAIYRSNVMDETLKGNWLTVDGHTKAIKTAFSSAMKSYIAEFALGQFGAIVKPKFKSAQDIEKMKLQGLQRKYGYAEGILQYAKQFSEEQNPTYMTVLAGSTAADNRYGIYSNPQSIHNFDSNKQLVKDVDSANPDSDVIGYFLNEGNPSVDYSTTSDEYLYIEKVNGKPLKERNQTTDKVRFSTQKRAFNNEYYPYSAEIDLWQQADAIAGREQPNKYYDDLKKAYKETLFSKYPDVGLRRREFESQDRMLDIRSMAYMLQDKNFMSNVGSRSKIVKLSDAYINKIRPMYVEQKKNGISTKEIDVTRNQVLIELAGKDPDVMKFFQIFFYKDTYEPIDNKMIWGR